MYIYFNNLQKLEELYFYLLIFLLFFYSNMEYIVIIIDNYDICKMFDIEKKMIINFQENIDILLNYCK